MVLVALLIGVLSLGFVSYLLPWLVVTFLAKPRDLKKAYDAKWALVTGSSSGIGKSLAKKLASQGLNVVLVALDEPVFEATLKELRAAYPGVELRKVGVDLSKPNFLDTVTKATRDIDVQVVFCNAGYILTGFFEDRPLDAQMANLNVNASSAVAITHHYLRNMLAKNLRGCFVYTSSAAAAMPSPFSVLYAATKSFVSAFGASLAAEVKPFGIDVCVFHPSPVASRFYDNTHKLDVLEFFRGLAVSPDALPDAVFAAIGRTVWADLGSTAVGFRLVTKLLDYSALATITAAAARFLPDFRRQAQAKTAAQKSK